VSARLKPAIGPRKPSSAHLRLFKPLSERTIGRAISLFDSLAADLTEEKPLRIPRAKRVAYAKAINLLRRTAIERMTLDRAVRIRASRERAVSATKRDNRGPRGVRASHQ
jgi:hypothetical protein